MVRKLNIDNVVNFLNQLDYSILDVKQNNTSKYAKTLVHYFLGDDYEVDYIEIKRNDFTGTYIKLNENKVGKILHNVSLIEFTSLYPHVLIKLLKSGELKINIKEFATIYEFLVTNRFEIKQHPSLITDGYRMLKYIINSTISILFGSHYNHHKPFLYINNVELITTHTEQIFSELMKDTDNILYIDCDSIYLQNVTYSVTNKIDKLGLPYDIINDISIYFHQLKRYIALIDGRLVVKGLTDKRLKGTFSEIVEQLNILNRYKKVKKLIKKVNEYVY
jgi:hypothetical protein